MSGKFKIGQFSPGIFFPPEKNNFSGFLQVDIYIYTHMAHYYRKSMEWSGESSPLGRLLMPLSKHLFKSKSARWIYIYNGLLQF